MIDGMNMFLWIEMGKQSKVMICKKSLSQMQPTQDGKTMAQCMG